MRLCQAQTRASNTLPRCRETNRRTPGTAARRHGGTAARILKQASYLVAFPKKMAEIFGCERWFCERERERKTDLGLCRQNRSIRQKRSPATVHNRKSLPNFRVWGHDFPKDRAQHGKTCKPQRGQSPTPGKHACCRRGTAPHDKIAHHGNARALIPEGARASEKPD